MLERIKSINNPLTVVAIFAALSEVAGAVTLPLVESSLQSIYIWFVMGFPIILLVLFFLTLNFNSTVLYAPGDYEDEANFLAALQSKKYDRNLDQLTEQIEKSKTEISELRNNTANISESDLERISNSVVAQLDKIKVSVDSAKSDTAFIDSLSKYILHSNFKKYIADPVEIEARKSRILVRLKKHGYDFENPGDAGDPKP